MSSAADTRLHNYARYKQGCRCTVCRAANADYARRRYQKQAYGQWQPYVEAGPVREHVEKLAAAGVSARRIEQLAGVSRGSVSLLCGWTKDRPGGHVRQATAERILALGVSAAAASAPRVDSIGTVRRIQALCAIGWPITRQEQLAGKAPGSLREVMRRPRVSAATAATVRTLYDRLWTTPAPPGRYATVARLRAEHHGWPPPMAWDDDNIDDPAQLPATTGGDGQERLRAWLNNVRTLEAQGQSRGELTARLRTPGYVISERMRRAFDAGLINRLDERDRPKQRAVAPCGTRAAYARHKRRGEQPDRACVQANATYQAAYLRAHDANQVTA
ncbi:hypothetical protein [Actinoplanes sp. URMC 104]|uniref:hypothetical protein n=1 Tax=Actinoplanes sp. URMC 104 TaxID=3423409 RepID=UPI003F1AE5EE